MSFTGAIFRDNELLVTCELVYVFANPATQKSKPVPTALRETLTAYEAGEDMVQVRTGNWEALGEHAKRIRTDVFVEEQRIPANLEWDEGDNIATHAVAFNRLGQPVVTGRLLQHEPGVARIGRMAVHRALRGSGVGRRVLETLISMAATRGDQTVMLHAQRSAEQFYLGLGFAFAGEPFEEAGIPHIEMARTL
jgi:predicted GNAT family N-acyltransferase